MALHDVDLNQADRSHLAGAGPLGSSTFNSLLLSCCHLGSERNQKACRGKAGYLKTNEKFPGRKSSFNKQSQHHFCKDNFLLVIAIRVLPVIVTPGKQWMSSKKVTQ
ncbi:unnamed protein product [Allacma fusca]|uniref:Uncharacterized protein n=1 Tax=Allacma fusca TaxID=39272 RepID=A0A8J2L9Z8_9HEXA|nr:unnamed protein product [Allacma fusca]